MSSKKNLQTAFGMPLDCSDLQGVQAALTGTTATNADLQNISQDDFVRTAVIMLVGIIILLIVITRSVHYCFLGASVLTSLGISEILSWIVPFFSFIMIAALGVDYSIFLMMRYNELEGDVGSPAPR
ncbi:hypothetical protein BSK62_06660 [Paenibacillus odorifer]|nr:hypothetical protein BSK62_06660 [Paenibacillus odorifer]